MRTNAQDALLGKVARLHYEHGLTHAEIGELLSLSRVKVTRVLAEARRTGVVEITVHSDESPFADVESALARRFGLLSAHVCPSFGLGEERSPGSLGVTGAAALAAVLPHAGRIAVGLSTAVAASVAHLRYTSDEAVEVLPLAGSRGGRSSDANPHEVAGALARAIGGTAYHLPAPLLATTPEAAQTIRGLEEVRATLEAAAAADALVVGVGGTVRAAQALRRSVTEAEFEALRDLGAVGDVSARFFDADGAPVLGAVDDRVIGLTLEQMRRIPTRVGIAGGAEKRLPLSTALRTGLVNVVVTDIDSARAVLTEPVATTATA
ncbi:sugar-binding domain-containing protein [Kineococcus sp. NPDC059986]|jgi:lsr operon transcriptional repressor|uniref:sugar-binding transcriptional regulator n=1 Tax=Kineococcus sp. NPDC059986 TaxID=3155538 RepID=UPI00344C1A79